MKCHCRLNPLLPSKKKRKKKCSCPCLQQFAIIIHVPYLRYLYAFQSLKNNIETLTTELREAITVRENFEKDLEQTLQQLTEAKTSIADLKAQNDETSGKVEEYTTQNKVSDIFRVRYASFI